MTTRFLGVDGNDALFDVDGDGVIVNTRTLAASGCDLRKSFNTRLWAAPHVEAYVPTWSEIAECSSIDSDSSDVVVISASAQSRMYTIPKNVTNEATAGLAMRTSAGHGATAVGVHVAQTLSAGGQVPLKFVQHVARYFAHHEIDKRLPDFPIVAGACLSPERVAWSMWGGDVGWRWARQIAERTSSGLTAATGLDAALSPFVEGDDEERQFFGVLSDEDSMEVIALYEHDASTDEWQIWEDGEFVPTQDPPADLNRLVELDDESALYVAGALYDAPEAPVALSLIDPLEFDIHMSALPELDWDAMELAMTPEALATADDGYTPEERSKNAAVQLRDANGKFVRMGGTGRVGTSRVQVNGLDPALGRVLVHDLDTGKNWYVDPKTLELDQGEPTEPETGPAPGVVQKINFKGILGEPRAVAGTPKAWLPHLLPVMDAQKIHSVIGDYNRVISEERARGVTPWAKPRQKRLKHSFTSRAFADVPPPAPTPMPAQPGQDQQLTPDNSDVKPLYMAIVDKDDPQSVLDLVSMIPASSTSNVATTYRREGNTWVAAPDILRDLQSATPPPVVQLDDATYQNVLHQVDSSTPDQEAVTASLGDTLVPLWGPNGQILTLVSAGEGGLDRNRGNAEKLRRYWLYGPGAAKIRWGTGGDWTRCVRHLSKYLGPRAKGYCALRHHEATGMWTGDKEHLRRYGKGFALLSTADVKPMEEIIASAALVASAKASRARVFGVGAVPVDDPAAIQGDRRGASFRIPLVLPEGVESGDGRFFDKGALSMRTLPIPLLWQFQTGDGHDGSVLVGRVDRCERVGNGLGNAIGVFDTGPHGAEAERLVREGFLRWVSADLDKFQAEKVEDDEVLGEEDEDDVSQQRMRITKGRLMGITLVPKPAFQECTIELVPDGEINVVEDGVYMSEPAALEAAALVAAAETQMAIPVNPPADWFENPRLTRPSALTILDDGRVFGHIAAWDIDHIGMAFNTKPPRSSSRYAYFHTGVVRTAEGKDIPVGQLTLAGGHAPIDVSAAAAVKHYDDTASSMADVHAGEDDFGIWVAGALRPSATPEQIRSMRASAPSGDWRQIRGKLELVAICQVNVPGFPIARAQVASGAVMALVAAGAAVLARQRQDPLTVLSDRIAMLEKSGNSELALKAAEARRKIEPIRAQKSEALTAAATAAIERLNAAAEASIDEYIALSGTDRKNTMRDGSFPIPDVAYLKKAIRAYGRASDDKKAAVRRHIISRARALKKTDLIPSGWREASASDLELSAQDAREIVASARAQNAAKKKRKKPGPTEVPDEYLEPVGKDGAPAEEPTSEDDNKKAARQAKNFAVSRGLGDGGGVRRFTPKSQPRDSRGKFRDILARLKLNLGGNKEMQEASDKAQEAEGFEAQGDYAKAQKAASELIKVVDRVGTEAIDPKSLTGIREGSRQLGRALAYLPLPFEDQTVKLRFSDLPPVTREMIDDLIERVIKRIGEEDAAKATAILNNFKMGGRLFNQSELSSQLSKMLRLLT